MPQERITICSILNGQEVIFDESGALFWPDQDLLAVADLHFEKGSSFATKGVFLPPYDTAETLERLTAAIEHFQPQTIIALGDSFHDVGAEARTHHMDREKLHKIQEGRRWVWILGNHDPDLPHWSGGEIYEEVSIGPFHFRHEPHCGSSDGEICGHLHPIARIRNPKGGARRRCFATDGKRLILPAFGALTGGLNVRDKAFAPVFENNQFHAYMIARSAIFKVSSAELSAGI